MSTRRWCLPCPPAYLFDATDDDAQAKQRVPFFYFCSNMPNDNNDKYMMPPLTMPPLEQSVSFLATNGRASPLFIYFSSGWMRPTTMRRRRILHWHFLVRLCHHRCCIFPPHQRQQWLRGDDFFFGFFISTILCLSLYLLPHVASKHLTIGFIIITKFQFSYCWLLSVTDSNSDTKSLR